MPMSSKPIASQLKPRKIHATQKSQESHGYEGTKMATWNSIIIQQKTQAGRGKF